jgi:hypothetical protein
VGQTAGPLNNNTLPSAGTAVALPSAPNGYNTAILTNGYPPGYGLPTTPLSYNPATGYVNGAVSVPASVNLSGANPFSPSSAVSVATYPPNNGLTAPLDGALTRGTSPLLDGAGYAVSNGLGSSYSGGAVLPSSVVVNSPVLATNATGYQGVENIPTVEMSATPLEVVNSPVRPTQYIVSQRSTSPVASNSTNLVAARTEPAASVLDDLADGSNEVLEWLRAAKYTIQAKIIVRNKAGEQIATYIRATSIWGHGVYIDVDEGYQATSAEEILLGNVLDGPLAQFSQLALQDGRDNKLYQRVLPEASGLAYPCVNGYCIKQRVGLSGAPREINFSLVEGSRTAQTSTELVPYPLFRLSELQANPELVLTNLDLATVRLRNGIYEEELTQTKQLLQNINALPAVYDKVFRLEAHLLKILRESTETLKLRIMFPTQGHSQELLSLGLLQRSKIAELILLAKRYTNYALRGEKGAVPVVRVLELILQLRMDQAIDLFPGRGMEDFLGGASSILQIS